MWRQRVLPGAAGGGQLPYLGGFGELFEDRRAEGQDGEEWRVQAGRRAKLGKDDGEVEDDVLEAVLLQLRSSPLHGPLLQACPGGLLKWQACHPGLKRGVRCCGSSLAPACPGGLLYWQACPQGRRVRDLNVPLATPLQWRAPRLRLANPLQWRVLC